MRNLKKKISVCVCVCVCVCVSQTLHPSTKPTVKQEDIWSILYEVQERTACVQILSVRLWLNIKD